MNNSIWAHSLIDQLILQGVTDFCIAPGSRSTPLALAAARHPKARITVHFDERGLGFFALGLSVAKQVPTAIIVTSGTAVGNLLPAVMEACHSHVPLILLTADRPPELQSCGANQTTDQVKIFDNFVIWQTDLPCPDSSLSINFIRSQAAFAFFQAMQKGPVHVNCQFREPLFSHPQQQINGVPQQLFFPTLSLDLSQIDYCKHLIMNTTRGLILIGRMEPNYDLSEIFLLAKRLQWPIFADLLSGARGNHEEELFTHFDYAIQSKLLPEPDIILHFGGSFISKAVTDWIKQLQPKILHIHRFSERIDPLHIAPTKIYADPALFCRSMIIDRNPAANYLQEWKRIDRLIEQAIDDSFSKTHLLTEGAIVRALGQQIPDHWAAFFSNSMPIRDADHFFFPKGRKLIYANRGLAGIDGQIATAIGIAKEIQSPMLAVMGDQSCLYDLNSLALLRSIQTPFILIILNNFGGGIFSRLNVANEREHFDRLFSNSHEYHFEKAAEMFNLPYRSLSSLDWGNLFADSKHLILEIFIPKENNASIENQIMENYTQKI